MTTFLIDTRVFMQVYTQVREQIEEQIKAELRTYTHQGWEKLTGIQLDVPKLWWKPGELEIQIGKQARELCGGGGLHEG